MIEWKDGNRCDITCQILCIDYSKVLMSLGLRNRHEDTFRIAKVHWWVKSVEDGGGSGRGLTPSDRSGIRVKERGTPAPVRESLGH